MYVCVYLHARARARVCVCVCARVQSWVQYVLLFTFNHCLKSFLEVRAVITNMLNKKNKKKKEMLILKSVKTRRKENKSSSSGFHSLTVDAEQCADSVGRWMTGNRLKLNNDQNRGSFGSSHRRVSVSQRLPPESRAV